MTAPRLEIRLLGGFRASRGEESVGGFESNKVRALLAYLGLSRGRSFSRDTLAALLWPEESEGKARRNLRQAIYNLRQVLSARDGDDDLLEVTRQAVTLRPGPEIWFDVDAFSASLDRSREASNGVDVAALRAAARLYEGELLAGFHLSGALELEEWLAAERERVREEAADALLLLIDHHLESGSYSLGVEYGYRLITIDPLSEEARRRLMRLHAFSGRRSRAIAEYLELERLLAEELGVEPAAATQEEYRAIVAEELPRREISERAEPVGPLIPMVGREAAMERLRKAFEEVAAGGGRLTLVTGEAGVGKTRLLKTFLHEGTAARPTLVLQGRYHRNAPLVPYLGIAQALGDALVHEVEVADRLLGELDPAALAELALLVPVLHDLRPGPHRRITASEGRESLFGAVAAALRALCGAAEGGRRPVVLFLDDLHAADPSSLDLLDALRLELGDDPVWIVGSWGRGGGEASEVEPPFEGAETLRLERLGEDRVREIVDALIPRHREELFRVLASCGGLPLAIAETINLLWDGELLVEHDDGSWTLRGADGLEGIPGGLEEVVLARIAALPTSARRLFTLAAVAGPEFDAALLETAEQEMGEVVEAGIRVLLERWMSRLRLGYWADSRKERDISLWASGPRRGTFEFSHPVLRELVYGTLDPERRAILHRRIAEVLDEVDSAEPPPWREETLAHHAFHGRAWERAAGHLEAAARNALRLGAGPSAAAFCRLALEALDALAEEGRGDRKERSAARDRIGALAERAAAAGGGPGAAGGGPGEAADGAGAAGGPPGAAAASGG